MIDNIVLISFAVNIYHVFINHLCFSCDKKKWFVSSAHFYVEVFIVFLMYVRPPYTINIFNLYINCHMYYKYFP